jgi:MarR family transcriptional regulator, transcriptional regulator for hemolysin
MKEREHYLGLYFGMLTKRYFGVLTKKLEGLDIDRHFFLLIMIDESKEKCTQQYLADTLLIDKVAMVKNLDYLSEKGYIVRETNLKDRRETHVNLTAKAKKTLKLIYVAIEKTNKEAASGLTEKEVKEFFKALETVNRNLSLAPSKRMVLEMKKA